MATYILTAAQLNNRILNSFSIPAASAVPTVSDPNAQAFLNAAVITDVTQANAINNLVIGLKADGLWTPMQALYPFVGGTAFTHKWNLKDPRDLNVAYRLQFNGDGVVHSSNGVVFDGVNSYGDTNYVNLQSGEFGAYSRGGTLGIGGRYSVNWQGGDYPIYWLPNIELYANNYTLSGFFSNGIENENGVGGSVANANLGFSAISSGGQLKLYRNGTLVFSLTPSSGTNALPIPLWLGGVNYAAEGDSPSNPNYFNSQLAFAFITATVLDATQNTNLYNRVQAFQTALSRQV
jgi:hypothetical protein